MTPEEQRAKCRAAYQRKKEWRATLDKYADFAAYIVRRRKREERQEKQIQA